MAAVVLFTLPYKEDMEVVIAQTDNGDLVWSEAPEELYTPSDAIDEADTYPLSLLPPDRQTEVMERFEEMPEELYESILTGWEAGEIK